MGTTETEPKTKPAAPTAYVVLRATDPAEGEGIHWAEHCTVEASGATAARQVAFERMAPEDQVKGATFVAVPARSWQPKRRKLDTKPRSVEE